MIAAEVDLSSLALAALSEAGYRKVGESANHFGKGRPASFMERLL